MSAESILSRELDIRFIDARNLINEAKVSLDVFGYIDEGNQVNVLEKASELFRAMDHSEQLRMKQASWELRSIKMSSDAYSVSDYQPSFDDSLRSLQELRLSWPR
eukprot:Nitzschia sp. Nitz4//scaffold32_size149145//111913//112227//NITZ4_002895-RA/size149145-processed-gene-0.100-mRNA-1//1//CDS//3329548117//8973//frame0